MATHYNLWLEYPGDWRRLRDFFFDACKCTAYWIGPNTFREGRPDDQAQELYAMHNEYNLISLGGKFDSRSYKNDVHVFFTLNGKDKDASKMWEQDVVNASVAWLAGTTGDALLDLDGLPVIGRQGNVLMLNDLVKAYAGKRMKAKYIAQSQARLVEALDHECLEWVNREPPAL